MNFKTARLVAVIMGLAWFAACKSTTAPSEEEQKSAAADESKPYDPNMWEKGQPTSLGYFLAELDKSMRAWTNLTLTAQSHADRAKASKLQKDLMTRVNARRQELVDTLESGPPRNRVIAAGALGFSASNEVQGPLIVALGDDNPEIVQNAALSLALLQNPQTPMLPLLEILQGHPNGQARANACYAVRTILEAGAPAGEDIVKAARNALVDTEPFAQAQAALILAMAGDGESIPHLSELLAGDSPLVISAALQALVALGRDNQALLGPAARALVAGFGTVPRDSRDAVQRALVLISGHNYAEDVGAWAEWSQRLP